MHRGQHTVYVLDYEIIYSSVRLLAVPQMTGIIACMLDYDSKSMLRSKMLVQFRYYLNGNPG